MGRKITAKFLITVVFITAVFFIGLNAIDSMVSSIASVHPEVLGSGRVDMLFFRDISFVTGYHLGIVLMVVSYFLVITVFCFFISKEEKEK